MKYDELSVLDRIVIEAVDGHANFKTDGERVFPGLFALNLKSLHGPRRKAPLQKMKGVLIEKPITIRQAFRSAGVKPKQAALNQAQIIKLAEDCGARLKRVGKPIVIICRGWFFNHVVVVRGSESGNTLYATRKRLWSRIHDDYFVLTPRRDGNGG